jgi:CheY-like chemotaxis protein
MESSHRNTGPVARVLIVEDFPAFRRFICSTLRGKLDWRVIAEVADGLEAVQKAAELKPDLILLDIGLPTINGIEAARQIRKLSPESKIVFVSQESSADVVEEALSTGAWCYVVKTKAASQLLAVVEAVISGTRFVNSFYANRNFTFRLIQFAGVGCRQTSIPRLVPFPGCRRQAMPARVLELSIAKSRSPNTLTASGIPRRPVCPDS